MSPTAHQGNEEMIFIFPSLKVIFVFQFCVCTDVDGYLHLNK